MLLFANAYEDGDAVVFEGYHQGAPIPEIQPGDSPLAPLMRESNLASWDAAVGGGEEALERATRARSAVALVVADAEGARKVRAWLEGGVADPLLRRQLVLLDHEYTRSQLPPETIEDLVRPLLEAEPILGGEVVFGARCLHHLESQLTSQILAAWDEGRSSLRAQVVSLSPPSSD